MGTRELSRIKIARRPATGHSYPCRECGEPICPGEEYFCYQLGQRWSEAYCMRCARTERGGNRSHHQLYAEHYGVLHS